MHTFSVPWKPIPQIQAISRIRLRATQPISYLKVELKRPTKCGISIILVPITKDEPKPKMWQNRYGTWFCHHGLHQGRGTTQRGAWDDLWEQKACRADCMIEAKARKLAKRDFKGF